MSTDFASHFRPQSSTPFDVLTAESIILPAPLDKVDTEVAALIGGSMNSFVTNLVRAQFLANGWVTV